jgi:quinol monooxygenase YgiN
MIIVAGTLYVSSEARAEYLASCEAVIELARSTPGCLDFALSADPVEATRINVFEAWEDDDTLVRFRGSGPSDEQLAQILDLSVHRYRISSIEPT